MMKLLFEKSLIDTKNIQEFDSGFVTRNSNHNIYKLLAVSRSFASIAVCHSGI